MEYVLGILLVVLAAVLVACVLMQSGKGKKLSSTITGSSDTFFAKGKAGKWDQLLSKVTVALCIVFFVVILVLYCLVAA